MEEGVALGGPHRSLTSNHFGKKEGDQGRKEGRREEMVEGFFFQASSRIGVWGKTRAYKKASAPTTRPKVHLHRF